MVSGMIAPRAIMTVLVISASWVFVSAAWNIFQPRIPNWLSSLGFILAIIFRWVDWSGNGFEGSQLILILLAWFVTLIFWRLRWIGGGDAKFVMIVILAFPDRLLIACLLIFDILGLMIYSLLRDGVQPKKMKQHLTGNLGTHLDSKDRLRATTFLGIGWFLWLGLYL